MKTKDARCALMIIGLLVIGVTPVDAAKKNREPVVVPPSAKKGDPPPGNAMSLSVSEARAMLKDAVSKAYQGAARRCWHGAFLTTPGCGDDVTFSGPTGFHFRLHGFDLTYDGQRVSATFDKAVDYLVVSEVSFDSHQTSVGVEYYKPRLYHAGDPSKQTRSLLWSDEPVAQRFAEAFNRLMYATYHDEESETFRATAKAWRENPVKPPLSQEADRERILAENAIKEGKELGSAEDNSEKQKKLDSAIAHYESALEIQPMWPAGWFNVALLYAEQKNYADASDSMKHYLELVPDASDAQSAREQMIIWEDKAKH